MFQTPFIRYCCMGAMFDNVPLSLIHKGPLWIARPENDRQFGSQTSLGQQGTDAGNYYANLVKQSEGSLLDIGSGTCLKDPQANFIVSRLVNLITFSQPES